VRRAKGARDEYGPDGTRLRRLLRHRQSVTTADTGTNVLSRVLGLVLATLSVQIILDGIRGSFGLR